MAQYKIVTRHPTLGVTEEWRKQLPAAQRAFEAAAYRAIRANAWLDTKAGRQAWEHACAWSEGDTLDIGAYRLTWWRVS